MEGTLAHDFVSVRVHQGAEANDAARAAQARACIVGQHIVLGEDISPPTSAGQRAHSRTN
jgi:hypothetical protein